MLGPTGLALVRLAAEDLSGHDLTGGHHCHVLDGAFAVVVQALLFVVTVATLAVKWMQERPRRALSVFLLDCSKQMVGAGACHIWNLVGAIWLDAHVDFGDQCTWYWLNIMVDTTFGVLVAFVLLQVSMLTFRYDSGHYLSHGGELDYAKWMVQCGHWVLVITGMKLVCVGTIFGLRFPLHSTAEWVLSPVQNNDHEKLLVVMVLTPGLMNLFQFVVQDHFLKWKGAPKATGERIQHLATNIHL
jgi:hypothetical protein